jgi:hypothetical protein
VLFDQLLQGTLDMKKNANTSKGKAYDLGGTPLAEFRYHSLLQLPVLLLTFVLIFILTSAAFEAPIGIIVICESGMLLVYLVRVALNWRNRIYVMTDRLVIRHFQKYRDIPWQEIESVNQKITALLYWDDIGEIWSRLTQPQSDFSSLLRARKYTVYTYQGDRIIFDGRVNKIKQLGELIQQHVADVKLPEAIKIIKSGDDVGFDRVSVNKREIRKDAETVRWDAIKVITHDKYNIHIRKSHESISVSMDDIPNAMLFLELIKHLGGNRFVDSKS